MKDDKKYISFTLIELLIVIITIGIISALIMPGFHTRYQAQKFQNYCYKFMNFLKKAQNKAIVEGRPVVIEIKSHHLILAVPEGEDNQVIADYPIPEEYKIDTEIDEVYFYPSGEFKIICDQDMKEEGVIKFESRYGKEKIYLWAGSGNIFVEE
jgi:type II secretion system protein H